MSVADMEHQPADITQEQAGIWDVGMATPLLPRETVDYDYNSYEAQGDISTQTNYRIWTSDATSFYYLPSAYVEVAFQVQRADGTQVTISDQTALCSNGWSLFETAALRMNDVEVAQVQKPGKLAQVTSLIDKGRTWMDTIGKNSHYYVDRTSDLATVGATGSVGSGPDTPLFYVPAPAATATSTTDGAFQPRGMYDQVQFQKINLGVTGSNASGVVAVQENPNWDPAFQDKVTRAAYVGTPSLQHVFLPLSDIFPLCDLDRVVQGTKIEVVLQKINQDAEALFGLLQTAKISIQRIKLWVARLRPSLNAYARVESQIASTPVVCHIYDNYQLYLNPYANTASGQQQYQIIHRQNKPTKVFIAFQYSQRSTDTRLNPLQFDLLGTRTPPTGVTGAAGTMTVNVTNVILRHNGKPLPSVPYDPTDDYSRIVYDLMRLGAKQPEDSACITWDNWRDLYPIFGFDLSLLEGAPYEARSQSTLQLTWSPPAAVSNPYINSNFYNVYAVVVSEGSALVDFSSGITNIRTV